MVTHKSDMVQNDLWNAPRVQYPAEGGRPEGGPVH